MHWIKEVEIAKSMDDLVTSLLTVGRFNFPDYDMLDSIIASALKKLLTHVYFRQRVSVEEQLAPKYDRFWRGKQTCTHDQWTLSSHRSLWSRSRSIRSIQSTLTEWWRSRYRYKVGPSFENRKWNTNGHGTGGFTQVKITWIFSASKRIDFAEHSRNNEQLGRGRVLWVESNWTMFERRLMQFPSLSCIWKHMRGETRRTLALSCTKSEGSHWRKDTPKVQTAEERVPLEQGAEFRAEIPSEESVRIRHSSFGTLPCVFVTSLNQDAHMVINADFDTLRPDVQPSKKLKKSGVKGSVALFKNSIQFGCVSQEIYRREDILRKTGKLRSNCTVTFSKGTWHHIKIRERRSIARRHSKVWISRAQPVRSKVWGDDTRRNVAPRTTCSRSCMVFGEECLEARIIGTKATFFSPSEVWSLGRPVHWQLLPLWGSWTFEEFLVRLGLNLVCLACASMNEYSFLWLFRRGCQFFQ